MYHKRVYVIRLLVLEDALVPSRDPYKAREGISIFRVYEIEGDIRIPRDVAGWKRAV